jgi:hypothetical protein
MTAASSAVVRDGREQRVPSAALVRGDILVVGEGDAVGADARLLRASALRVQEASLTGESEAVLKDAASLHLPMPLADRRNMVFKGTAVAQGTGRAVVTATGMETQVGAIAGMLEATVEAPTPLQKEIARVGRDARRCRRHRRRRRRRDDPAGGADPRRRRRRRGAAPRRVARRRRRPRRAAGGALGRSRAGRSAHVEAQRGRQGSSRRSKPSAPRR